MILLRVPIALALVRIREAVYVFRFMCALVLRSRPVSRNSYRAWPVPARRAAAVDTVIAIRYE